MSQKPQKRSQMLSRQSYHELRKLWACVECAHCGDLTEAQARWLLERPVLSNLFVAVMEMGGDGKPQS